jgi:hypothetical protein
MSTKFWSENVKGGDHWEDLDVDGSIILRVVLRKWDRIGGCGRDNWINLTQDRIS